MISPPRASTSVQLIAPKTISYATLVYCKSRKEITNLCNGAVVQRCNNAAMVQRCGGTVKMVRWCGGALVKQRSGTTVKSKDGGN